MEIEQRKSIFQKLSVKSEILRAIRCFIKYIPFKPLKNSAIKIIKPFLPKRFYVTLNMGQRMFIHPNDSIEWGIFSKGEYEPELTDCFTKLVKKNYIILDIGAHTGYYTLLASKLMESTGTVHAFEPMPDLFERLRANIKLNECKNVVLNETAIWAKEGELYLHPATSENSGNSSIFYRYGNKYDTIIVKAITIDEYINKMHLRKVDLIKIDIEGSEPFALIGGRHTLEKYKPDVICEVLPKLLSNFGYSVSDLRTFFSSLGYKAFLISSAYDLSNIYFSFSPDIRLPVWNEGYN